MASQDKFGDERLKKDGGAAIRGPRDSADVDRVHQDGGSLTAEQRRRMIRQEWIQEVLPTPPAISGFHLCWVSTTNSTDPIHKRLQLGYQPVRASEVPGFDQYIAKDGQFEGCVACNEMLLFKIPNDVYQDIMAIYHHDIPLEQEQRIREQVTSKSDVDSEGRALAQVEGDFDKLGRSPARTPHFA